MFVNTSMVSTGGEFPRLLAESDGLSELSTPPNQAPHPSEAPPKNEATVDEEATLREEANRLERVARSWESAGATHYTGRLRSQVSAKRLRAEWLQLGRFEASSLGPESLCLGLGWAALLEPEISPAKNPEAQNS